MISCGEVSTSASAFGPAQECQNISVSTCWTCLRPLLKEHMSCLPEQHVHQACRRDRLHETSARTHARDCF